MEQYLTDNGGIVGLGLGLMQGSIRPASFGYKMTIKKTKLTYSIGCNDQVFLLGCIGLVSCRFKLMASVLGLAVPSLYQVITASWRFPTQRKN